MPPKDAYEALVSLGHSAPDARQKIEQVTAAGRKFQSVEEILEAIYQAQQK